MGAFALKVINALPLAFNPGIRQGLISRVGVFPSIFKSTSVDILKTGFKKIINLRCLQSWGDFSVAGFSHDWA